MLLSREDGRTFREMSEIAACASIVGREREDSINVTRGCEGDGDGQVFANGLELVLEYLCVFEGKIKN